MQNIIHEKIRVDIPFRPAEEQLPNGVRLVSLPMPREQLLRLDICFRGGISVEDLPMQAHFAISQNGGSRQYPPAVVSEKLDFCGAEVTTLATAFYTRMQLVCLPRLLPRLLPVLLSILDDPTYGQVRLRQAVATAHTSWLISRQRVEKVAKEKLNELIFPPSHPLSRNVQESDFQLITPVLLRNYQQKFMHAGEAVIFLTGKTEEDTLPRLRETLGEQPWGGRDPAIVELPPMPQAPYQRGVHHYAMPQSTVQSALRMGFLLLPPKHPDMPALRLANTLLGGFFGSRLMSNLREERGFTYDIHSRISHCPGGDILTISTEVNKETTEEACRQVEHELMLLGDTAAGEEELEKVKNYLCGRACRRYEERIDFANVLVSLHFAGRTIDDLLRDHQSLLQCTPEEVRKVANKYLNPNDAAIAVVG